MEVNQKWRNIRFSNSKESGKKPEREKRAPLTTYRLAETNEEENITK